jgi:hypothetical protein
LEDREGCFEILESFLKHEQTPNACLFDESSDILDGQGTEATLWQSFIVSAVLWWNHEESPARKRFGEVVETFLGYGADPHIWASVLPLATTKPGGHRMRLKLIVGRERRSLVDRTKIEHWAIDVINSKGGGELTLQDIVKHWQLDNAAIILQLLDRNVEMQDQAGQDEIQTPDVTGLQPEDKKHVTSLEQLEEKTASETPPLSHFLDLQLGFICRGPKLFVMIVLGESQPWTVMVVC